MEWTETRKVTDERGNEWSIKITLIYDNHSEAQLVEKAFSFDVIKLQNPWRKLSNAELEKLQANGYHATAIPKGTRTTQVREMTPDEIVAYVQAHPELKARLN